MNPQGHGEILERNCMNNLREFGVLMATIIQELSLKNLIKWNFAKLL